MRISDWSSDVCSSDLSVCAMIRGYSGLGAVLDQAEEVPAPTTAASPAPEPPQQAAPAAAPPPADEPRLNRTGRTMTIVVPVKDGPRVLGDVDAQITPDDALLLSVEEIGQASGRERVCQYG